MARINLLPWRAERRKHRQKEFVTMLGGALVAGVALVFAGSWYYDQQIEGRSCPAESLDRKITGEFQQGRLLFAHRPRRNSSLRS